MKGLTLIVTTGILISASLLSVTLAWMATKRHPWLVQLLDGFTKIKNRSAISKTLYPGTTDNYLALLAITSGIASVVLILLLAVFVLAVMTYFLGSNPLGIRFQF